MKADALIVADIHLNEAEPDIIDGFLRFLQQEATKAKALYILGDLFEFWIGDDDPNPLHQKISDALLALSEQNIRCYFIHGNRDLLLGKRYAKRSRLALLPSETVINIGGQNILLLHGDELCTFDKGYQYYRRIVHCSVI